MSVIKGVYEHLNADVSVTSTLASYDFGSGSQPAIFTVNPPPQDAPTPLVLIVQTSAALSGRDRTTRGGEIGLDVTIWGDRGESEASINDAAMVVWRSLDRATISVSGYEVPMCLADPPVVSPDPDGFPGYRIAIRILIRETPLSSS